MTSTLHRGCAVFAVCALVAAHAISGHARQATLPDKPLGVGPWVFDTFAHRVRVVRMATLHRPWGIAFLPDGGMLVTERPGRLRMVRNGTLDPQPISGGPQVLARGFNGLHDIALHPDFARNRFVYLTYSKPSGTEQVQPAIFRGRLEGMALVDGRDIFVTDTPSTAAAGSSSSRMVFGPDGMIYMTVSGGGGRQSSQDPATHRGKVLRLRDDGAAAPNNPFLGKAVNGVAYKPEIYSIGHRNSLGLAVNPETGELWSTDNGPLGGDELNVVRAGKNYGWPLVTFGRDYSGKPIAPVAMEGRDLEPPLFFWSPNPVVGGLMFYTGDRFPRWKHSVLIAGLAGYIERIMFNERWEPVNIRGAMGAEKLLRDLGQRIRDVRQGQDGLVYALTDEDDGALLRIEPAQ